MKKRSDNVRKTALCAVLAAFGVVVLLLGSFVEVLDLTVAMLASLVTVIAVIEAGSYWPWLTYAVITVVSLLVLPYKMPAAVFLFAGYYPIIKEKVECLKKPLAYLIKFAVFNASTVAVLLVFRLFVPEVDLTLIPGLSVPLTYLLIFAAGNVVFILYDVVLTRLITLYIFKLRDRLGIGKHRKQ